MKPGYLMNIQLKKDETIAQLNVGTYFIEIHTVVTVSYKYQ